MQIRKWEASDRLESIFVKITQRAGARPDGEVDIRDVIREPRTSERLFHEALQARMRKTLFFWGKNDASKAWGQFRLRKGFRIIYSS